MATIQDRYTVPARSAGDRLMPATPPYERRPIMSTTVLADAVDVERLLDRRLSARHCGRSESTATALRRLEVWARARPWELAPQVVARADRILRAAERAESTISAASWLESLPEEICDLLDRRRPGAGTWAPAGTFTERSGVVASGRRATDRSSAT